MTSWTLRAGPAEVSQMRPRARSRKCGTGPLWSSKYQDEDGTYTHRERIPPVMSITMFSMLQPTVLLR